MKKFILRLSKISSLFQKGKNDVDDFGRLLLQKENVQGEGLRKKLFGSGPAMADSSPGRYKVWKSGG